MKKKGFKKKKEDVKYMQQFESNIHQADPKYSFFPSKDTKKIFCVECNKFISAVNIYGHKETITHLKKAGIEIEKIKCPCGGSYFHRYAAIHFNTKLHRNYFISSLQDN